MPAPAAPPIAPVAPPQPPVPAPAAAPDPLAPQQIRTLQPDDDPNHHMAQLIARRKTRPAATPAAPVAPAEGESKVEAVAAPPAPAPAAPAAETPPDPKSLDGLNNLIARTLAGSKKADKPKAAPAAEEPKVEVEAAAAAPAAPAPEAKKSIISKKKTPPPAPDAADIASAATTAAVRAMGDVIRTERPEAPKAKKPEDDLKSDDLHDYQVALKMAEIDPRFKDAPKVILDHVKRAEGYAARWEASNPGKEFDPNAEEHNEFYEGLDRPWGEHDFRNAEIEMAAERVAARTTTKAETRIKALEQDNARMELNPVVDQTFINVAAHLAKELNVYDKVANGKFDEFAKEDPLMAGELSQALVPLRPLIEAIVQIDDPRGRFALDDNNPAHQAWKMLLSDKEAEYAGTEHDGKMFATRIAWWRMPPEQRARHWYLTADHLVSEVVKDAVATVSTRVDAEKERVKKVAESMGWQAPAAKNGKASGTPPSNQRKAAGEVKAAPEPPQPTDEPEKPISPSVGSGAKIDSKGTPSPVGKGATLSAMHNVLFS